MMEMRFLGVIGCLFLTGTEFLWVFMLPARGPAYGGDSKHAVICPSVYLFVCPVPLAHQWCS